MRAALILVSVQALFYIPVLFILQESSAIWASIVLLVAFVGLFLCFLFFEIYDTTRRNPVAVVFYTISNISSIILMFANLYRWVGLNIGGSDKIGESIWECVYFSVVTWTTVGYGDIAPSIASRPIAATEAMVGYIVMALVITMLISIIQSGQNAYIADLLTRLDGHLTSRDGER